MFNYKKFTQLKFTFIFIFLSNVVFADNHNLNEVLELIQKEFKNTRKSSLLWLNKYWEFRWSKSF